MREQSTSIQESWSEFQIVRSENVRLESSYVWCILCTGTIGETILIAIGSLTFLSFFVIKTTNDCQLELQ